MPRLTVIPALSRWEKKQFLQLPWRLYQHVPNWVPPLRSEFKERVGYRPHPFYEDAEIQTFLALLDGKPVGRIAAILNRAHNRCHNERRGFFGFFEAADDPQIAAALFEAVRAWLGARGAESVRGPTNPSMNYECGLLVEGFDGPPTFMMTYNPPYYGPLIEGCGFRKAHDLYALRSFTRDLPTLDRKMHFIAEEATKRLEAKVRRLDPARFREEVRIFFDIYKSSLEKTWGFVPFSPNEIQHVAAGLRHLIVPELMTIIEAGGRPVAATLGILDYNPLIKRIDGRLFPFGFLRLLWQRRSLKRSRSVCTGVRPELQNWGLGLVLLLSLIEPTLARGIEEIEYSWILESNRQPLTLLQRGGARITNVFRLYDREI